MKICFLKHAMAAGGAERTVAYLSNYFVKEGIDVDLVLYGDKGFYELDEKINIYYISEPNKSKNFFYRLRLIIKRFRNFYKYVQKNKPDLIFCMLYPSIVYALPFKRKIPIITSERSNPESMKSLWEKWKKQLLFNLSHGIVFQTNRAKEYFKKKIQEKGIVIPNALGNEYIERIREDNLYPKENKITAMGRIHKAKDYITLMKAFQIILNKYSNYNLEIYGRGDISQLTKIAKEMTIDKNTYFMGACPDALLKVANSKCYVLSSIYEGMPNALMEAMAIGLPCVSTDCPNGPAELIEDGVNGLLVPVGDEKAMAKAILKMIEDEEFAKKCGENAKKIKETHSVEINAKRYLDFFKKIVNKIPN